MVPQSGKGDVHIQLDNWDFLIGLRIRGERDILGIRMDQLNRPVGAAITVTDMFREHNDE